jgi:hypothetical protein
MGTQGNVNSLRSSSGRFANIMHYPSRLVAGEQICCRPPAGLFF